MVLIDFYNSIKKSWKLKKISIKLARGNMEEEKENLDKLIDLCFEDKYINIYLHDSGIQRDHLRSIYGKLSKYGAGQFVDDHYVAASSLTFLATLDFIMEYFIDDQLLVKNMNDAQSSLLISNRLVLYFQNREMGEIQRF